MKKLLTPVTKIITAIFAVALAAVSAPYAVHASSPTSILAANSSDPKTALCQGTGGTANGTTCAGGAGEPTVGGTIAIISNTLIFILGAISVVMLIVGGIRYTTSAGNDKAITGAKNTVIYAIVGVVVALIAYAIVHFIVLRI